VSTQRIQDNKRGGISLLAKEGSSWIEVGSTGMAYQDQFILSYGLVRNGCDHNLYIRTLVIGGCVFSWVDLQVSGSAST
jgi:hypothetical protein